MESGNVGNVGNGAYSQSGTIKLVGVVRSFGGLEEEAAAEWTAQWLDSRSFGVDRRGWTNWCLDALELIKESHTWSTVKEHMMLWFDQLVWNLQVC